jgi:hypothetical protein
MMMKKILLVLLVVGLIGVSGAFAQYKPMLAANGIPVATPVEDPFILPYGNSKIFIWSASDVITAKRIEQDGSVSWTQTVASNGKRPHACRTTDGNIAIVWEDLRGGEDIYAHKFYAGNGEPFWGNEIAVATDPASESHPQVCQDNDGGVFIAWEDAGESLKMQHITSDGGQMWTSSPGTLEVTSSFDNSIPYKLLTNKQNHRAAVLYVSTLGQPWIVLITSEGVTIEDDHGAVVGGPKKLGNGTHPDMVESAGDYYTTWMTDEAELGHNIYAARVFVAADGSLSTDDVNWGKTGKLICNAAQDQLFPKIVADNSGNTYVCWNDLRNLASPDDNQIDIYMLRLDPFDGSPAAGWTANGNVVTDAPGIHQYYTTSGAKRQPAFHPMDYDSINNLVYVAWHDYRNQLWVKYNTSISYSLMPDIFMQVVQPDGSKLNSDLPLCSLSTMEIAPLMYASSPTAFWYDYRSGGGYFNIYMQRADAVDTHITGIITSPASSSIKIEGAGFGCSPDYWNADFALNTDYNNITVNGTTVPATAWSTDEITVNLTYDSLAVGSYDFIVTAYGDPSNTVTVTVSDPTPPPPPDAIHLGDASFDGAGYRSGDYITSKSVLEIKVSGSTPVIATLSAAKAGQSAGASVNIINNYADSKFTIDLGPILGDIFTGLLDITVNVEDGQGDTDSATYRVEIPTESEVQIKEVVTQGTTIYLNAGWKADGSTGSSTMAAGDETVRMVFYGPSGRPFSVEKSVVVGYNAITIDPSLFDANGIYVVKIFSGNKQVAKTHIVKRD